MVVFDLVEYLQYCPIVCSHTQQIEYSFSNKGIYLLDPISCYSSIADVEYLHSIK